VFLDSHKRGTSDTVRRNALEGVSQDCHQRNTQSCRRAVDQDVHRVCARDRQTSRAMVPCCNERTTRDLTKKELCCDRSRKRNFVVCDGRVVGSRCLNPISADVAIYGVNDLSGDVMQKAPSFEIALMPECIATFV
jgi:hypothetical protein